MILLNDLSKVITDSNVFANHFVIRDGFLFKTISEPHNVYDALVIMNPVDSKCTCPRLPNSVHTLDEHIQLINELQLEKAFIYGNSINFINMCPSLNCLSILPLDNMEGEFDFSPLYTMPKIRSLHCRTEHINGKKVFGSVDYSLISGLEDLSISGQGHLNCNKVSTLIDLGVGGYTGKNRDLTDLIGSRELKELSMFQCKNTSLAGIEYSKKLQNLSINYNRCLADISHLKQVKDTLQILGVSSCPKITNLNVISELTNLEFLTLKGGNSVPNLDFLRPLTKLKYLYLGVNVENGDLSLCRDIPYVICQNRKHYNFKDKDLPKNKTW